jgi:hypothetical protein
MYFCSSVVFSATSAFIKVNISTNCDFGSALRVTTHASAKNLSEGVGEVRACALVISVFHD